MAKRKVQMDAGGLPRNFTFLLFAICFLVCFSSPACTNRPVPPGPYVAIVANREGNSVAVADLGRMRLAALIPVAGGPEKLAVRPRSHEVFVVSGSGTISVIRFPEFRVQGALRLRRGARSLVFARDGRRAFILDPAARQILYLDCDSLKEVARVRAGSDLGELALAPDGKTLLAVERGSNRLVFVGVESRQVLGSVEVGRGAGPLAVLPDGSRVFVADTEEEKVSVAEIATRQILSHLELGVRPTGLALKPDGGELFVLSARQATLTIVDTFHNNVAQTLTTGREPSAAVFRRDSSVLYTATAGDGNITAFDVQNRVLIANVHAGVEPRALALTPDERFLVGADPGTSSLVVLRTDGGDGRLGSGLRLVATIAVGAGPVDVTVPEWIWKR